MWLDKLSWGTLHEIAHGYQAGFDNQGIFTGKFLIIYLVFNINIVNTAKKQIKLVGYLILGRRNR